jgi:hypothetical protein
MESFGATRTWRAGAEPPLARPRQLLALAVCGGRLSALGGRGPGPDALAAGAWRSPNVESYAPPAPA